MSVVAITGATGGLGRELCRRWKSLGHSIIAMDLNLEALLEFQKEMDCAIYACDLTDRKAGDEMFAAIELAHGVPDIWINNAGIAQIAPFEEISPEGFDQCMDINFRALLDGTRYWLERMKRRGSGRIVNIASVAGLVPAPMLSSYNASKFAVVGLTGSLQQELRLAKSPVGITLVCPGFIRTNIVNLGEERGFPKEIEFLLADPKSCCHRIVDGVMRGEEFIDPTGNGKLIAAVHRFTPGLFKKSVEAFAPKSWKKAIRGDSN